MQLSESLLTHDTMSGNWDYRTSHTTVRRVNNRSLRAVWDRQRSHGTVNTIDEWLFVRM